MKALLILLFLTFATVGSAQTISVQSGEHDGFTRLVFTFPKLGEWSLLRSSDGYELSTPGGIPSYDLGNVFRRIATDRLARIFVEPSQGVLKLSIACKCYAMPFELGNGILVIDIKDGAPPEGSSFELSNSGDRLAPLTGKSQLQPRPRPKDAIVPTAEMPTQAPIIPPTLSRAISNASRVPFDPSPLEEIKNPLLLDQARQDLLWQLSKGATAGIVDIEVPVRPTTAQEKRTAAQGNIRIGEDLGLVPNTKTRSVDRMTGAGERCIPDKELDIGAWAPEGDVISGIALGTTNLVGEFDRADPDAIKRVVRYYLALGFGAEARLVLDAFKVSAPDRALWETLSHILDLEVPPGDVFADMEVCDTSAALWSVLAKKDIPPLNQIAIPAVLRSFSALPLHLRRLVGPDLASRFLSRGDTATARAIRDAILRAPGGSGDRVQMLEAEIALANGDTSSAEDFLLPLSGGSGPLGIKSIVALIQAKVDKGEEVLVEMTTTAESLLQEARGGENEAMLTAALALGYASQNRFESAFGLVAPRDPEAVPIWGVLAGRGNDEALLNWGLFQGSELPPPLSPELNKKAARRLLDLGFPEQALIWLGANSDTQMREDTDARLLAAEAELSLNKLPKALARLDGLEGDKANRLRGIVLAGMRADNAVSYLGKTGQVDAAADLAKQTRDWSGLGDLEQGGVWQEAVSLISPPSEVSILEGASSKPATAEAANNGPLAQTRATLDESAAARAVLNELLAQQSTQGLLN